MDRVNKIVIDGKQTSFSLGIDEDEIEKNDYSNEETMDLTDIIEFIDESNEQNRKN